jgi:hypothetical protein
MMYAGSKLALVEQVTIIISLICQQVQCTPEPNRYRYHGSYIPVPIPYSIKLPECTGMLSFRTTYRILLIFIDPEVIRKVLVFVWTIGTGTGTVPVLTLAQLYLFLLQAI